MKAKIVRSLSTDEGTFGKFTAANDDGSKNIACETGELPWRNNEIGKSCIPAGTYKVQWLWSPKHQRSVYHVQDVPGRTVVEIHAANLMGDIDKGYVAQLEGCISPGSEVKTFDKDIFPELNKPQRGVTNSLANQQMIENFFNREEFELEISWAEQGA